VESYAVKIEVRACAFHVISSSDGEPVSAASSSSVEHSTDLPVRAGEILEGKFRVERIIGEGAMGLVVEATHLDLEERVALKFLRREALARPEIASRFAREARAAAKIKDDHVARVYDVGGTDDGTPFIVMEFLEGMDLEVVLSKQGPLAIAEAAEHIIQACEGLTAAHTLGIVHRDIKPANLFCVDRPGSRAIKLLDFGISKAGIRSDFDSIDLASASRSWGRPITCPRSRSALRRTSTRARTSGPSASSSTSSSPGRRRSRRPR